MRLNRQKATGWIGLALFAVAAAYVLKDKNPRHVLGALLIFAGCLAVVVAGFFLWEGAGRLWRKLNPPQPLWIKPREVSALFDQELFAALQPRLDRLQQDGRDSLWRDRETGQLWKAAAWDYEFTENVIYTPVDQIPEEWRHPG